MTDNNRFDKLVEMLGESMDKRDRHDYKNYIRNELGDTVPWPSSVYPWGKKRPSSYVSPEQDQEIGQFLMDVEEALRLSSKGEHTMLRQVKNRLEEIKSKYQHIPDMSSRKVLDPASNE